MKKVYLTAIFMTMLGIACSNNSSTSQDSTKSSSSIETKDDAKSPDLVTKTNNLEQLAIGASAPLVDKEMTNVDGKSYTLNGLKEENGLLVIFSCNTCPYVVAWEDRYPLVAEHCKEQKIGVVIINSNEALRSGVDSQEEMKKHATDKKYTSPYVVDENHELADAFGATRTPETFLFDKDLKLVYHGAIDDNMKSPKDVENFYVKTAVNKLVKNEEIDPNITKSIGCTIKRLKKS